MSDPSGLLRQMAERSERKLRLPKNLAKGSWYGMDDFSVRQMVRDEIVELLIELGVKPVPLELDPNFRVDWDRAADEAGDVYHETSMGADPHRGYVWVLKDLREMPTLGNGPSNGMDSVSRGVAFIYYSSAGPFPYCRGPGHPGPSAMLRVGDEVWRCPECNEGAWARRESRSRPS